MTSPTPRERTATPTTALRFEVDLGDALLRVMEFSDGMWALDLNAQRVVVTSGQMQEILDGFERIWRG